jgi:hypothetical protein
VVTGGLALLRSQGAIRRVRAAGMASLAGVLFGMGDVWLAPDYSPLVLLCSGLVINQSRRAWFGARARVAPPIGPPPSPAAPDWIGVGQVASRSGAS